MSAFGPMPDSGSLGTGPMEATLMTTAEAAARRRPEIAAYDIKRASRSWRIRNPMSYDSRAEISARCYTRVQFDRVNLSFLEMSRAALNG